MTEPHYFWQRPEFRVNPMTDLSEEEFVLRLEEIIEDLDYEEQPEVTP
jgi:hypothetical protein